ncbi:hypothetical protein DVA67_033595 [Solirubrobacter sp. CPCC 204708]|uniref:Uncharacterized protein n=1 Tax=Solirubrobacter deserti TaxID=2282478 RepID=A0ABT4RSV6_9ACTN|nr:hypothetical protein [Solirubrobacter deserti]MBE2320940.1 hypothetical protein [Solirubrobacter deserti]MDA0141664.1 hypothetical protein [Solirubrobacter deserti]
MLRRRLLPLLLLLAAGCGSVRAAADCLTLDVRPEGKRLAATVRVGGREDWRVVIVHEGHVAWRGTAHGPFTYTHRMKDYSGPDRVTVRATGPGGEVCTKTDQVSD